MDNPAALYGPQYVLSSLGTSSAAVTIEEPFKNVTRVIIDNTAGSTPAFVTSAVSGAVAVFPTSATVASMGSIVGAGTVQTYFKNPQHGSIAAIRASGTADLYVMIDQGD